MIARGCLVVFVSCVFPDSFLRGWGLNLEKKY